MTTEYSYPLDKALKVANYIVDLLSPHCAKIHIAGSIRRLKPEVKDIEIVCLPKKQIMLRGLFDYEEYQTSKEFIQALSTITYQTVKGSAEGKYMQIITTSVNCKGIKLDLFMPHAHDYFRQYAIRTGSADYSHYVIATAWSRKGWTGIDDLGLRKKSDCDCKIQGDKKIYTLKKDLKEPTLPPVWTSEAEFFAWLNIPYIDPEHRIISL
jgi:DNA polymerase/3'-5' exonuclease PolX